MIALFGAVGECTISADKSCIGSVAAINWYPAAVLSRDKNNNWQYVKASNAGQSIGYFADFQGTNAGYQTDNDVMNSASVSAYRSSLLVRSMDTPVATVSSPAALSLFALGLCGLLLRRRKIAA